MYAIFETGGKQYKVEAGDVLRIEKIQGNEGDLVKFENVIAFSDGEGSLQTGTPYLDAATVNATVLSVGKGGKVIIFKFKSKKDYRKKQGHRQPYTEIEIENFSIGGNTVGVKPEKPAAPEPKEEKAAEEDEVKEKKPAKAKASAKKEAEAAIEELETVISEIETEIEEVPAEVEAEAETEVKDASAGSAKLTKADIMVKLDELGVEYSKSAKKDELLAIMNDAESK